MIVIIMMVVVWEDVYKNTTMKKAASMVDIIWQMICVDKIAQITKELNQINVYFKNVIKNDVKNSMKMKTFVNKVKNTIV